MPTIAYTARVQTVLGLGTTRVQIPHVLGSWPSDNANLQEIESYTQTFEAIDDVERIGGYDEMTLAFKKLTFGNLCLIAQNMFYGGVTFAGAGPYTLTHNSASTADLSALTAEIGVVAGSNSLIKRVADAIGSELIIKGSSAMPFLEAELKVRGDTHTTPASFATTTALLADGNALRHSWLNVYVDGAPGDIGDTEISCNRIDFELTLNNNLDSQLTDCGVEHGRGSRSVELKLNFFLDDTAVGLYADYLAMAQQYIRLEVTDPVTSEAWQFDVTGKPRTPSHGTQGNFESIAYTVKSQRDATWGYEWRQVITKATNTFSGQ